MTVDDVLNGISMSTLRISNGHVRKRGQSAGGGAQKMDLCFPPDETVLAQTNASHWPETQDLSTPSKTTRRKYSSEPSLYPPREEAAECRPRRRDLQIARRLYILPYFISGYLQLFLNVVVVGFCVYLLWCFYSTIRDDIDTKVQLFSEEVVQQMSKCSKDYRENRCDPELRVPAMDIMCRTWEQCMQQDPMTVATRAKFSAETMGEGLNAFFEKITWKTIVCMCLLLFGFLISYNVAFYFAGRQHPNRMRAAHWDPVPYYPQPQVAHPQQQAPAPAIADNTYCFEHNRPFW